MLDANSIGMGWLLGGTLGGIVIGWLTTCWSKVKTLFWRIMSYVFTTVELRDPATSHAVLAYLMDRYKCSTYYDPSYGVCYEYMRTGKYGMVPFEYLGGKNLTFWKGWKPLFYGTPTAAPAPSNTGTSNGMNNAGYGATATAAKPEQKTTLFFVRGTFDPKEIVADATKQRNGMSWDVSEKQKVKRFFIKTVPNRSAASGQTSFSAGTGLAWYQEPVHQLIAYKAEELGRCQPGKRKALDLLVYPQRVKNLINEIIIWRRNRDWYIERGIPWKRGWLLYGPPGTGKTALVRAFAEDLDLPLFAFSLGELMNSELQKSWDEMQAHTPCIALFEDIDNVFHGRKNVFSDGSEAEVLANALINKGDNQKQEEKKESKIGRLSFDCLLNCLDGVNKADGVFVVITTNHVDKIDEAIGKPRVLPDGTTEFISTRPGRIDKAIELTYMLPEDKIELAERILTDCPEGMEQIRKFVDQYPELKETPAQFQERCAQVALSYFWKTQAEGICGHDASDDMMRRALMVHAES